MRDIDAPATTQRTSSFDISWSATINIHRGFFEVDDGLLNKGDPFVKIYSDHKLIGTTQHIVDTHHPTFNEGFNISLLRAWSLIKLEVIDYDSLGDNDFHCSASIFIKDIITFKLNGTKRKYDCERGWIEVSITLFKI